MGALGREHPTQLQCKLLSGATALVAQLLLAVLAFAALVYKRHRERPQRPYKIWVMDVSKQVFSSGAGHICGLIIALVASNSLGHIISECAWYFVAFCFDTTLGVSLAVLLHRLFVRVALRLQSAPDPEAARPPSGWAYSIGHCGNYGEPPAWGRWAPQMTEWLVATVAARGVCGMVVIAAKVVLQHAARLLDRAFGGKPTLELFAVMIFGPLLMNMVQAWVQDAVLKLKCGVGGGVLPLHAARLLSEARSGPLVPASLGRSEGLHVRADASSSMTGSTHGAMVGKASVQHPSGTSRKPGSKAGELVPLPSPMEAARLKAN